MRAEMVDPVMFAPRAEYAFRHPLIQTVAYRSQLKSARAQLHRRLAAALQERDPVSMDENAALIAEHLEAAGDLPDAFAWHMRAGGWLTFRDVNAARLELAAGPPCRRPPACRRPEPRSDAHRPPRPALRERVPRRRCRRRGRLRQNCAGSPVPPMTKLSLALAMAGHVMSLVFRARYHESSQLATELTGLVDSFSDAGLAVGLLERGDVCEDR